MSPRPTRLEEIKSGNLLAETHPGVFQFRRDIIKALCAGTNAAMNVVAISPDELGGRIVRIANAIIERTEQ